LTRSTLLFPASSFPWEPHGPQVALPEKFSPLDGGAFVVEKEHKAYHHYMKVVATHYRLGKAAMAYQILATNQVSSRGGARVCGSFSLAARATRVSSWQS